MPKLHLKRTAEEEAARQWRKAQKKDSRRRRRHAASSTPEPGPSTSVDNSPQDLNYDQIYAEAEERRFREKMAMAFDDDDGLGRGDAIQAQFNDFVHVPQRWGGKAPFQSKRAFYEEDLDGEFLRADPTAMDEEEYSEWIRAGMYRKTHQEEYEAKKRRKEERHAEKARQKAVKAESARLEAIAEYERSRKRSERTAKHRAFALEYYQKRWAQLSSIPDESFAFDDIPWPIFEAQRQKPDKHGATYLSPSITLDHLTAPAISSFLFAQVDGPFPEDAEAELKRLRKERLRETFLRFHPDKFEGKHIAKVQASERDRVRQGLAQVVRVLNDLGAS